MTLKEFKIWFAGYAAGIDASGAVSISGIEFEKLAKMVAELTEFENLPKWTPPQMNKTMPLNYPYGTTPEAMYRGTPTFDPSVVYSNGAVANSSTGSK